MAGDLEGVNLPVAYCTVCFAPVYRVLDFVFEMCDSCRAGLLEMPFARENPDE